MKSKYLFVLICLVVLLAVVLPSCGGGDSTTVKTTAPTKTTAPAGDSLSDILGKGADIDSIKYDMSITMTGVPAVKATVWQKKQKMREEITTEGITMVVIFDMDENVMYMYYPEQNMAMEMVVDEGTMPESPLEDSSEILENNPNITGTETIDGKDCVVVTYEVPGEGNMKMWIWKEKGFPIKMEMVTSQGTTTIEFSNIDLSDIPDSAFKLPDDVTIIPTGE